ncbi:MAG: hypothetical protein LLG37_08425 [Spirochaetia bacterium]|nr:hypothetical protein [Spirochaetia bacterium]
MDEIDIDKMIEKKERKEKAEKKSALIRMVVCISAGVVTLACIACVAVILLTGDRGESYFPLDKGMKYIYNRTGAAPEEWTVSDKTENISGYECFVMNITDKGTYMSRQEYYCVDEEQGIARLAYSENYGARVQEVFKLMPHRLKTGEQFNAANIRGATVKAVVGKKETVSTSAGEYEAYSIDYRAPGVYDMTVWYAKDIGIVKKKDNISGAETGIISAGN